MNIKARLIVCLLFAVIVCFVFYLSGFDFDERGEIAGWCFFLSVIFGFVGFACPYFDK